MVTILRSPDATYVSTVVALLEAEGIPVQHPGMNHAALLPGLTYIEIALRVPRDREAEALTLLREFQEGEGAQTATGQGVQVFRVKRTQALSGALLGWLVAVVVVVVFRRVDPGLMGGVPMLILGAGAVAGYLAGASVRRDTCSGPSCGGHIPVAATTCPKCSGTVRGEIKTTREHFAALDALAPGGSEGREPPP